MYSFDPYNPYRRRRAPQQQLVRVPVRRQGEIVPQRKPTPQSEPPPRPTPVAPAPAPSPKQTSKRSDAEQTAWKGRYARLQADLDNTKKRLEKRYVAEAQQSKRDLLRELLPLADNLQAALRFSEGDDEPQHLRAGVELTLRAFLDSLAKNGVQPIAAQGQPFDPTLHEAMGQVESPEIPGGHVAQEMQRGYTVNGQLLRPARVLVAA